MNAGKNNHLLQHNPRVLLRDCEAAHASPWLLSPYQGSVVAL